MAFKYALSAEQQTPTSDSKVVLCKSFKIDIAAGSGFTTATAYALGWLPKDAQVVAAQIVTPTAVSGGTVSAATLAVTIAGNSVVSGINVFAAGSTGMNTGGYYGSGGGFQATTTDQAITYTPTLTGAGATAGIIYINLQYVV
jgi:hypothetical protein